MDVKILAHRLTSTASLAFAGRVALEGFNEINEIRVRRHAEDYIVGLGVPRAGLRTRFRRCQFRACPVMHFMVESDFLKAGTQ